jgi:hypothetical protein
VWRTTSKAGMDSGANVGRIDDPEEGALVSGM